MITVRFDYSHSTTLVDHYQQDESWSCMPVMTCIFVQLVIHPFHSRLTSVFSCYHTHGLSVCVHRPTQVLCTDAYTEYTQRQLLQQRLVRAVQERNHWSVISYDYTIIDYENKPILTITTLIASAEIGSK